MSDGKIVQDGTSKELFNNPKNDFVASFFGYINRLDGVVANGVIQTVLGEIPNQGFEKGEQINMLVRPHDFKLKKEKGEPKNSFMIEDIKFLGSNIHIWFNAGNSGNNDILAIQTNNERFIKGDHIKVNVDTRNLIMFKQSS